MGLEGSSPGLGDQFNSFGIRRLLGDNRRNYSAWFNNRFPGFFRYAANKFHERIKKMICAQKGKNTYRPMVGSLTVDYINDDYENDPDRYCDPKQNFYERRVQIGDFQVLTDSINVSWDNEYCPKCYTFLTTMYVSENTGDNRYGGWAWRERKVRMGDWPLSGGGCCD